MFFAISKILIYLLLPSTWVFLLLVAALLTNNQRKRKRRLAWAVGLFFVLGNVVVANELLLWWERPPTAFASISPNQYELAIVLTGFTADYKSPKDRIYLMQGADRAVHCIRLWKEGKVRHVLISGAEFDHLGNLQNPDRHSKELFTLAGVPDSVIWVEDRSKNTYQNAMFSAEMLKQKNFKGKILLVSSATHLRRAEACFRKAGVEVESFSTDFLSTDRQYHPAAVLIPSVRTMQKIDVLAKEIFGTLTYWLMGYL